VPNLYEVQHGNNPFAIEDSDADGLPDGWLAVHANTFAIYPPSRLTVSLSRNQTAPGKIFLNNDTATAVNYSVAVSANTGPSYSFQDSVTGSTVYSWEDISTTGTLLPTISGADDLTAAITLSGFVFPFYGQTFSAVSVSSNGCLMFGEASTSYSNIVLPSTSAPSNLIALFWDDLNPGTSGDIYYKEESNRLIVQYQNVARYGAGSNYTFQAVLHSDGRIEIRYQTMTGVLNSATIGIQNLDRSAGLTASSDTAYVSNNMAVTFYPTSEFFTILPTAGTVAPHSRVTLDGLFHSLQLPFGDYTANVAITHDGGAGSPLNLTANLNVKNVPTVINITSPTNQSNILQGQTVTISANATDVDSQIVKVEFFDNGVKLGEDLNSPYQYSWTPTDAGSHIVTAKSTDASGDSTTSAVIPIQVLPDADQDGMDDIWEAANGLDIAKNDAMEDLDGDRVPNIFEYYRETLPNDDTSYPAVDFIVDPATGNTSTTDNIYSTIGEAINKANEYVWNAQTQQNDRPNAWAVIEVKSGGYEEELYLSDMPVLLLAELGSPQGPVELRSPYSYSVYLNTTCALDGFVITHRIGVEGSGVYSYASGPNNPGRALTNCIIKGNNATYGGGIYNNGNAVLRIAHCTIVGNQASYLGQAIYNSYNSKIDLVNSIIWGNSGAAPSAIYQDPYAPAGSFTGGTTSMIQGGEQGGINENPLVNPSGYLTTSSSPASNRPATILAKTSHIDIHGISRVVNGPPDLGVEEWMDADTDGLPDWFENTGITDPAGDNDSDFVSNLQEYALGLNSSSTDSDGDGLSDGDELYADSTHGDTDGFATNALSHDTDSDGMSDGWESANGFNPTVLGGTGDADSDGLTDLQEYVSGTNPHASDTDGDTMPDGYEVTYHLDPFNNDASQDHDGDSLTNLQEYTMGTNPDDFDSDGDLLPDWWEIQNGLNPNSSTGLNGQNGDDDSDGVLNLEEYLNGTNPHSADSDSDTVSDRTEINQGSNPSAASDGGQPPPADTVQDVPFHIYGDYASWEMTVVGQGPDDQRTLKLITNAPGQSDSKTLKLRKSNKYEVRMRWQKSLVDSPKWYCWEAQCDGLPTEGTFNSYSSTRNAGVAETFVVGGAWLMDNRPGLLTSHVHMNDDNGGNVAGSLAATLLPVELITPAGDPVDSPVEAGSDTANIPDGANEFTYSSATTGVLTVKLKAKVEGIGGMSQSIQDKFKFEVDAVGDSVKAWDAANPEGKPTVNGDFLTATVTFTTLPTNNSHFGNKKARVIVDGQKAAEKEYEVFFPTYATNHPNDIGSDPDSRNWYYYWKQTSAGGDENYTYDATLGNPGETVYSGGWKAKIGPQAASTGLPGANDPAGIDFFAWAVRHEGKHVSQLSGFWGGGNIVSSLDLTDGDGFPTAIEPAYMTGSPYDPDNVSTYLDDIGYKGNRNAPINDIEDICMRTQSAPPYGLDLLWTNGSANSKDWANPGMQHQTLGKFDD